MLYTRWNRVRLSLPLRDERDEAGVQRLRRRWETVAMARPATCTALAGQLLKETLTTLQSTSGGSTSPPEAARDGAAEAKTSSHVLLSTRESSENIWRALERQRVPWQDALALIPLQLTAMSPARRRYLASRASRQPWRAARFALAAWDAVEDVALLRQYNAMKNATFIVEYARLVSAALRERPALPRGLLPVPYHTMVHCYTLGQRSPEDATIALGLSQHMTVLGWKALSREARERLALHHAALEGLRGNWQSALAVAQRSPYVRLSTQRSYEDYVRWHQQIQDTSPTTVANGRETPVGPVHFRACVSGGTTASEDISPWEVGLRAFLAQEAAAQTYAAARRVLEALPDDLTQGKEYLLLASSVMQACARRMFPATLTRRLKSSVSRADWATALSLSTAAQYYDIAVPLISYASDSYRGARGGARELPSNLCSFVTATERLSIGGEAMTSLTAEAAAKLTYPEALAHALMSTSPTTWRVLLDHSPHAASPDRLRFFLLASCADVGKTASTGSVSTTSFVDDRVQCCTFQSRAFTHRVCAAASRKDREYFCRVLPSSLREHHFSQLLGKSTSLRKERDGARQGSSTAGAESGSSRRLADVAVASNPTAHDALFDRGGTATQIPTDVVERWRAWDMRAVTKPQECSILLADLSAVLRAAYTVEGAVLPRRWQPRLTEQSFLKAVARLAAGGVVQLSQAERFYWPLEVFKAASLLRVPLDASLVSNAGKAIPSQFLDRAGGALPSVLAAQTLLGAWQEGLKICARLIRKHQEGEILLEGADYVATARKPYLRSCRLPLPTLLEAMAQVGFAVPPVSALPLWHTLYKISRSTRQHMRRSSSHTFLLLLLDVKERGDVRQLCEEVQRANQPERESAQGRLHRLSWRRELLGAAFILEEQEHVLQRVLRAAGQSKVRATDLDAHGLQRIMRVLPLEEFRRVIVGEVKEGRCAHEHLLCDRSSCAEAMVSDLMEFAHLRSTSSVLSAVLFFKKSLNGQDPQGCLKALVRLSELVRECPYEALLLRSMARLLLQFLADDDLLSASIEPPTTRPACGGVPHPSTLRLAQGLYNRLQEVPRLSIMLKESRHRMRQTITTEAKEGSEEGDDGQSRALLAPTSTPFASWVVLITLLSALCRHLQYPLPARMASHLLRRAVAADASDWRAALTFFNIIRNPSLHERELFVRALRHSGAAATPVLLSHRRFLRGYPEQVVVWADEESGSARWAKSIELLVRAREDPGGAIAGDHHHHRYHDAREPGKVEGFRVQEAGESVLLKATGVLNIIRGWNDDERQRCADLLRRQGFLRVLSKKDKSFANAEVAETLDASARAKTEAILRCLKESHPSRV